MIYPQDGAGLEDDYTDDDLTREERQERSTVEDSRVTLDFILNDLGVEIAKADSITGLGITSRQDQKERDIIILSNARFVTLLEEYKTHLESLRDQYLRS